MPRRRARKRKMSETESYSYWSNLPVELKQQIIGSLDFWESRRLSLCSHHDKQVVEKCPVHLSHLSFDEVPRREGRRRSMGPRIKTMTVNETIYQRTVDNFKFYDPFFTNQKSTVDYFEILVNTALPLIFDEVRNRKIRASTLDCNRLNIVSTWISRISAIFNTAFLKKVSLTLTTPQDLVAVAKTSQWKSGIFFEFRFNMVVDLDYDILSEEARKLKITCPEINEKNSWKMIKSYRDRNLPLGSFFVFFTSTAVSSYGTQLLFDVQVENRPLRIGRMARPNHTQRFEIPKNSDNVLIVEFYELILFGLVCRKNCIQEDYFHPTIFRN